MRAGCSRFRDLGVLGFVSWFTVLGGSGFRFKGVQGLGLRVWDRWGIGRCLGLGGSLGFRFKGVQGLGFRVWDCCGLGGVRVKGVG